MVPVHVYTTIEPNLNPTWNLNPHLESPSPHWSTEIFQITHSAFVFLARPLSTLLCTIRVIVCVEFKADIASISTFWLTDGLMAAIVLSDMLGSFTLTRNHSAQISNLYLCSLTHWLPLAFRDQNLTAKTYVVLFWSQRWQTAKNVLVQLN